MTNKNLIRCYWQLFIEAFNERKILIFSLILFTLFTQNLAASFDSIIEYESEIENFNYSKKPNNPNIWQQKELDGVSFIHQEE